MISLAAKQGGETNFKKEPIKRSVRYPWEILEPPILKGGKKLGPHVRHIRTIAGGDNTQTGVVWSPLPEIFIILSSTVHWKQASWDSAWARSSIHIIWIHRCFEYFIWEP